jgi:hypothetical protein
MKRRGTDFLKLFLSAAGFWILVFAPIYVKRFFLVRSIQVGQPITVAEARLGSGSIWTTTDSKGRPCTVRHYSVMYLWTSDDYWIVERGGAVVDFKPGGIESDQEMKAWIARSG